MLFPFNFVYVSAMIRRTTTSQNLSLCDDLSLKWLPGPETYIAPFYSNNNKQKIHYTFFT
jgi:hypothetical protein